MVTLSNWEEYAILRADGELDATGVTALETFLAAHPGLAEEARMLDSLRLVPDEAVMFAGKESLLKPEPRVISFDRRWVYGVAAGVALLVGSLAVMRSGVEGTDDTARIAGGVSVPVRVTEVPQNLPGPADMNKTEQAAAENTAVAQTTQPHAEKTTTERTPLQNIAVPLQPGNEQAPPVPESIAPLTSADTRMLAVATPQERGAESLTTSGAGPSLQNPARDDSHGILNRLPIDADRFALVDDLRQTASDRIQNIRDTREKIRNTDVTVALGRRELFTLHF